MPIPSTDPITTIDSHTAGHPTRVITGGLPILYGKNVAEKMAYFEKHHDNLRTLLLHEPRGHSAMVGVVMTKSHIADFGAFFLGSYKYLEMCGHASIGLAVTLDHLKLIAPDNNKKAMISIEVPAGMINLCVHYNGHELIKVSLDNVPAFVEGSGTLMLDGKKLSYDIAYGGNRYALFKASDVLVNLSPSQLGHAMDIGSRLKRAVNDDITSGRLIDVNKPVDSILFYCDEKENGRHISRQLVILEANKFDRSPCGTGTSARLAQMILHGDIKYGETILSRNIFGIDFEAVAIPYTDAPNQILPNFSGMAFITGHNSFILQNGDPFERGFLWG